jgi:hypothetical protein
MAIEIENLDDLDATSVAQQIAALTQLVQEKAPSIDVKRGVLHDLLLYYSGILATKNQEEMDRLRQSQSIAAIQADPTLADDTVVDNIASNYRVARKAGGFAGGAVTIIIDSLQDTTIAVGSIFTAQGKSFITEQPFVGRTSSALVTADSDRLITDREDGTYSFEISVVAQEEGEASQLVKGTALVPDIIPRTFIAAVAAEDFIGGFGEEQNAELVARFVNGMATKTMSSRSNMSAYLRENFTSVVADSLIGFGDAEMLRDRHSVLPISLGGRADWYIQTQPLYRTYGANVEATLVEKKGDGLGVWQINFDRDDYPGLYTVTISPKDQENTFFAITALVRGFDSTAVDSNDGFVPELANASEAAFSRFQTVSVSFKDTLTSVTGLTEGVSKKTYTITVKAMPSIAEIQDQVSQRSARMVAGDTLIKAPVPCFVSFGAKILLMPGQAAPTTSLVADDLATLVNHWGYRGLLPVSALLDIIHNHLSPGALVESARLTGRIEYPDGTFRLLTSPEVLEIPYEPSKLVTSRTVLFFLDPANVQLDVATAEVLQV